MRSLKSLLPLFAVLTLLNSNTYGATVNVSNQNEKFAVYYANSAPVDSFDSYDLVVLDGRYLHPISAVSERVRTVLGYLSIGEIAEKTPYFTLMKKNNLLLKENENWKGSYGVDLRSILWQRTIIENIIPELLRAGFDGIFIDTLDSPIWLEEQNPEKYRGMKTAAIDLIKAIRLHYPTIKIMINRAYAILPKIASYIDMELGESLYNTYNFNNKSYEPVPEDTYKLQLKFLKKAQALNKNLKVYTLDYADKDDHKRSAEIYRLERSNGFIPYVTTIGLNEITPEPSIHGDIQ